MRLSEITEDYYSVHKGEAYKSAVKEIIKTCPDALANMSIDGKHIPFRGVDANLEDDIEEDSGIIIQDTDHNREPKDSLIAFHKLFNEMLYRKFGYRYRTAAVFATGHYRQAAEYGTRVAAVLPIGDYSICYSEDVHDAWDNDFAQKEIFKLYDAALDKDRDHMPNNSHRLETFDIDPDVLTRETYEELMDDLLPLLDKYNYKVTKDINKAVQSGNEMMIGCKKHALIPSTRDHHEAISDAIKEYH